MQHPDLVMMYRDLQATIDRQQAAHTLRLPAPGPLSTARAIAGNALIALGTRIAPAPRPTVVRGAARPALATGR
jgi:hypothetical protein